MRVLRKLCLASLACLLSTGAQAAIVTYQYTAVVDNLTEHDWASDTYTDLFESSFTGHRVVIGDVLRGILRYDTAALKSAYQPADRGARKTAFYDGAPQDLITYRFDATGMAYRSDPAGAGLTTVSDSPTAPGTDAVDYFSKHTAYSDGDFIYNADIFFLNQGGAAFQDTSLPLQLDASLFQETIFGGSIYRRSDLNSLYFNAQITSFELLPTDVTEPGAMFLLAAGAGSLFAARRRARQTKAG